MSKQIKTDIKINFLDKILSYAIVYETYGVLGKSIIYKNSIPV